MRIGIPALLCLALTFCGAGRAAAHAQLVAADPATGTILAAMPEQVTLHFSEPVAPVTVRWFPPEGDPIEILPAVAGASLIAPVPAGPAQGTWLLSWRVVSADGHPVGGSYTLSAGTPSRNSDTGPHGGGAAALAALARGLLTLALVVGVGGAVFLRLIARDPETAGGARRLAAWVALVTPVAAILALGAHGLDLTGAPVAAIFGPGPWSAALHSPVARTAAMASAAGTAAAVALHARTGVWLAGIAWALASLSFALSGHAATAQPVLLMAPAVALHGAGFIFWLGALPGLAALTRARAAGLGALLGRFSAMATPLVLALVTSGVVLAIVQVERPAALFDTAYGQLLTAKLVAVLGLLALAATNRLRLTPAIRRGDIQANRNLHRSVLAEIALGLLILALASGFRLTPPPRALHVGPTEVYLHVHGLRTMADVVITPGLAGRNEVEIDIFDADFEPMTPIAVTVSFADPARGIEPIEVPAAADDGHWHAGPVQIPFSGDWSVSIGILVSDFEKETLEGAVRIESAREAR